MCLSGEPEASLYYMFSSEDNYSEQGCLIFLVGTRIKSETVINAVGALRQAKCIKEFCQ